MPFRFVFKYYVSSIFSFAILWLEKLRLTWISRSLHFSNKSNLFIGRLFPANIRLDEDVLKTSFVFVFRRRLQDILIKTNMFTLASCLQKTSSRRLQEVLVKTNMFVLAIRLQDVFKTFARRLQDVFKTSSRRIIKLNYSS